MTISLNPDVDAVSIDLLNWTQVNNAINVLDTQILSTLNSPSSGLTPQARIQLLYAYVFVHTCNSAMQNPLLRDASKAYFEKQFMLLLEANHINLTDVKAALNQLPPGQPLQPGQPPFSALRVDEVFRNIFPVAAA